MEKFKYIDLHVHSNNSDGVFNPKQLIDIASKNNVGIISISDHDSIDGLNEFKKNISKDIYGIKGVEFSSYIINQNERNKIHILGYCFDEDNFLFKKLLYEQKEKRINSHLNLLNDLKSKVSKIPEKEISKLNIDRYCWFDREIINCFKKENYSNEIIEELRKYYKSNRFSYGMDYELDARKVIDTIHAAGGYVVFAHPMAYGFSYDKIKNIINQLVEMGIDGIEIFQSDCSIRDTIWLKDIVKESNLLYSVGSDFHRYENSDGRDIGLGINNNLKIQETSLTNKILEKKKYLKKRN